MKVSIAIPTYNRAAILVETLGKLFALEPAPAEILVVDQTRELAPELERQLNAWNDEGRIRWIRLPQPSIPGAMNHALRVAASPIVLFLDDDSEPAVRNLVEEHARPYADDRVAAVVGQVLQPGETATEIRWKASSDRLAELNFPFFSTDAAEVTNVIACNLSMRRNDALAIGGFDENFTGTGYRLETDFSWRLADARRIIRFEPRAAIRHLKAGSGGVRTWGDHLRSSAPTHSTGDYYLALLHLRGTRALGYMARRWRKTILTRFDLSHPWWIPVKVVREIRALREALAHRRRGRRLMIS
jgi:GT2 family glycosyltransferase